MLASAMFTKPVPGLRCHWKTYVFPMPCQTPSSARVSVDPRCVVPRIAGSPVLIGGAEGTATVAALGALTGPSGLVAVTTRRSAEPSSAFGTV